ncbi:MAG: sensor histidine kinase, partial [Bacteroidota bacterium]
VFNNKGIIQKANKYAREIHGADPVNKNVNEVFVNFGNPEDLDLSPTHNQARRLVNITSINSIPISLYFKFFTSADNTLALGEINNSEVETMRNSLIETNNELSISNRHLQKKQRELERLNEVKNKILGIAAHDLRTPVGNILNISGFLMDAIKNNINERQFKLLEAVHISSKNLIDLLNDLLDFSAIELGKLKLNLERTDILSLIKRVVDLNTLMAENKNIDLTFNHSDILPKITVDPVKIEQVLNNLISNAIKFSYPESTIDIDAEANEHDIEITVTDHGQGIPKEEQNNIFKPFHRTSVKSTANEKNTGLGLAIVWNIIKGHQGKIWIESEVAKGTAVHFTLPLNFTL